MNMAWPSTHLFKSWDLLGIIKPATLAEVCLLAPQHKQPYLDLQKCQNLLTLYCLYSLFWDIGPVFWALLEVQVRVPRHTNPISRVWVDTL